MGALTPVWLSFHQTGLPASRARPSWPFRLHPPHVLPSPLLHATHQLDGSPASAGPGFTIP